MLTVGYWGAIVVEISSSDGYIYRLDAIYVLCSAPVWHILSDVSAGLMLVLFWLQNWFAGMVFSIVFYNHVKVYQSGATAIKSIQVTICPGILRFLTSKGKHSVVPRGYEKTRDITECNLSVSSIDHQTRFSSFIAVCYQKGKSFNS